MSNCRPVATSMSSSEKISRHTGTPLSPAEATIYHNTVGALQYLMMTRPDLAFIVNRVCQYMQQPTDEHRTVVKRILCYLKFTVNDGLQVSRSLSSLLSATPIQIGPTVQMITVLQGVFLCSLVPI
jgi:hypothetical protein